MKVLLSKLRTGLRNLYVDLKIGPPLMGMKPGGKKGHSCVVNTDYALLPYLFSGNVSTTDVVVDAGCGRGRVINWMLLNKDENKTIGIEFDRETALALKKRMRKHANVTIIHGDVLQHIPSDATVFYLFNPFDAQIMAQFSEKLKIEFAGKPGLKLVYYRPLELDVFRGDPRWKIEEHKSPLEEMAIEYRDHLSHLTYAVIELV